MRFIKYLCEEPVDGQDPDKQLEELARQIASNCQQFLRDNPEDLPLYRGLPRGKPIRIETTREQRRPLDNTSSVHDIADQWFLDHTGVKYRSDHVVFVTGNRTEAGGYGSVHEIIPIGDYTLCWSPRVRDLYVYVTAHNIRSKPSDQLVPYVRTLLDSADYKTTNLQWAMHSNCEIMLRCTQYYAIADSVDCQQLMSMARKYFNSGL